MTDTYDLENELNLLDPVEAILFHDAFDDLVLKVAGRATPVVPARAFPHSSEDSFITLTDRQGDELGTIRDITALDSKSRQALETELERVYFTPEILKINGLKEVNHVPSWDVETDRGPLTFEIRSGRRDIRDLGNGRLLIRDADGNRYEIPDYRRLDPVSLALVESVI
jgi:hypothetical protein